MYGGPKGARTGLVQRDKKKGVTVKTAIQRSDGADVQWKERRIKQIKQGRMMRKQSRGQAGKQVKERGLVKEGK